MLEYLVKDSGVLESDRIAVGVSGGADSMLYYGHFRPSKKVKFYLKVINVNHNLRGEESDRDSLFVKTFCEKKKIPYEIVSVEVKRQRRKKKLTLEESARKLRYMAFAKIMKKEKLNKLFLAHHKNDQIETILMNILRGAGVHGACGIKQDGVIFRPLLNLKKSEILGVCKDAGIKFVEDSTNAQNDATRNYLRNVVVPEIEKIYPSAVDSIFAFGEKCKDVQSFIESQLNKDYIEEFNGEILVKSAVFHTHKILAREYLKMAFSKLGVFADIEAKHYELATNLFEADVNSMLNFPHNLVLKKTYGGIKISTAKEKIQTLEEFEFVIGKVEFKGIGVIETEIVEPADVVYGEGSLYICLSKLSTNAIWRTRRLGDVFAKLGSGSKKLNDYFTDKKVDVDVRDMIPLLVIQNQVLVVAGLDVSENVKIDGNTDQIVKITFHSK